MDEHTATRSWVDRAQVAGLASMGAGAIHLAAAGTHAEHPGVARIFVLLGAAQLAAGLWLALAGRRPAAATTIVVSVVALGGWLATRATGIGWIDGLDVAEDPAFADTVAAGLAIVAVALGVLVLGGDDRAARRSALVVPGVVVGALAVAAMLTTTTHTHAEGHEPATATGDTHEAGHAHDAAADPAADAAADPPASTSPPATAAPFDPAGPVDLSGTPGVSADQQAFAEDLVARTLRDLPQWSDPAAAEAAGFHSIGDGPTGFEHYVQWTWIDDDVALDPNHPESLVYVPQPDGTKQLVSAMYMLPTTVALPDVPDWGGSLMQWHVHDDLCFTDDPVAPLVRGVTSGDGSCAAPLVKHAEAPMIHVWITPHTCGPFAALEGIGAGKIEDGAERLCDHQHGG